MLNLFIRSLSGAVYVFVVMAAVFNPPYGPLFLACFLGAAAIIEWMQIIDYRQMTQPTGLMVGIFFLGLYRNSPLQIAEADAPGMSELMIAVLLISLAATQVFSKKKAVPRYLFHSIFGLVYIGVPLCLMLQMGSAGTWSGSWLLASVFILIWIADTFAFLVGKYLGKRKLFPSVSPGKTWEGFYGAIAATLLGAGVMSYFLPFMPVLAWLGLGLIVVLFGTVGDLFESALKRAYDLKDSGKFMPGHGGVLDRIDSFLFALPMAYFYLKAIEKYIA